MEAKKPDVYAAKISINSCKEKEDCTLEFSFTTLTSINWATREGISINTFNKLMIRNVTSASNLLEDNYSFSGPLLGLYHKTEDVREGPYLNHHIEKMKIQIKYDIAGSHVTLWGEADLSKSSFDDYYYKGPRTGAWCFELEFSLPPA